MARVTCDDKRIGKIAFSLVRQNDDTEVVIRRPEQETQVLAEIQKMCERFKTRLEPRGDEVIVTAA